MSLKERLEGKCFVVGRETLRPNEIPSVMVSGETLPEAWENSILATLEFGVDILTETERERELESKDASMVMVVTSPFSEPRIHRQLPGQFMDLGIYVQEVIEGVRDYRIGMGGSYTYHDRLFNWPGVNGWQNVDDTINQPVELPHCNQIDALIEKLSFSPYSRRAQAITWNPLVDASHQEPPCLQRIWCRLVKSDEGQYLLEMNTHWRSRDALLAAFMNIYALTEFQKVIAEEISELSGREVLVGRYLDFSDSYHLYGTYFKNGEVNRFLQIYEGKNFEDRTFRTDNFSMQRAFRQGREKIEKELREMKERGLS
jgi:thymidylate synthase